MEDKKNEDISKSSEEKKVIENVSESLTEKKEETKATVKPQETPDPKDVEENKAIAILSYISILFLIPLLAKKESRFCQFHAKQGMIIFLLEFITMFLIFLPGIGFLLNLAALVLSIIGIINAAEGEMKKIPLIGDFADKFNL